MNNFSIKKIKINDAKFLLLNKHYAKRIPNSKVCFGLFNSENRIIGCCIFGTAPSSFWNNGGTLFNKKHIITTYELNRLCIEDNKYKNLTSWFVSKCLKMLTTPNVVISYADTNENHIGYIYQALNFKYLGESKPMCKSKSYLYKGKSYHGRTMNSDKIKKILGDKYDSNLNFEENFLKVGQIIIHKIKHRYIYINSSPKLKKKLFLDLALQIKPYPKRVA